MVRFSRKQRKKPEWKHTIFIVFSDAYQELTLLRTGLLDDLRLKFETVLIVPSQLVRGHILAYFGSTKNDIYVFQDRSRSLIQKIIDALIALKYAKYAGPCKRRHREESKAPSNLLKRIRRTVTHVLARIIPESILLFIQNHILSDRFLDSLFKRYRPVLTILSWGAAYDIHVQKWFDRQRSLDQKLYLSMPARTVWTSFQSYPRLTDYCYGIRL